MTSVLENLTLDVPASVKESEALSFTLAAGSGDVLPDSITVTMGGAVNVPKVTGDIVITATGMGRFEGTGKNTSCGNIGRAVRSPSE